jgi:hypothetical protein
MGKVLIHGKSRSKILVEKYQWVFVDPRTAPMEISTNTGKSWIGIQRWFKEKWCC